jgi:hypothetical protein
MRPRGVGSPRITPAHNRDADGGSELDDRGTAAAKVRARLGSAAALRDGGRRSTTTVFSTITSRNT